MAGNSNSGRKLEKPWLDMLRLELFEGDRKKLRELAKVTVARALAGDMAAVAEIANRLDGKPVQAIDGTIEHNHNFVRAPEKASDDDWKQFLTRRNQPQEPARKRANGSSNGTAH